MAHKIILIDDDAEKGWRLVFEIIFKKVFGELVEFSSIKIDAPDAKLFYNLAHVTIADNPDALFILDNRFYDLNNCGLRLLGEWGHKRNIIMHSSDYDLGFAAGQMGAIYHMRKDDPQNPMGDEKFKKMTYEFIRVICKNFGLAPELAWLLHI